MRWHRWRRRTSFPAWGCRRCAPRGPPWVPATSCRRRSSARVTTRSPRGPRPPRVRSGRQTNSSATTPRSSCTPLSRPPPTGALTDDGAWLGAPAGLVRADGTPNRPTTRCGPSCGETVAAVDGRPHRRDRQLRPRRLRWRVPDQRPRWTGPAHPCRRHPGGGSSASECRRSTHLAQGHGGDRPGGRHRSRLTSLTAKLATPLSGAHPQIEPPVSVWLAGSASCLPVGVTREPLGPRLGCPTPTPPGSHLRSRSKCHQMLGRTPS